MTYKHLTKKIQASLEPISALNALKKRPKSSTLQITRSSKIFKTIIQAIQDKKGEHILSLDLKKINEATSDFFIICEASNTTQIKAIADFIEYEVKTKCQEMPYKSEGKQAAQWLLIDYINVVVHVMHPEARRFYQLEEMWSDADIKMHELKN